MKSSDLMGGILWNVAREGLSGHNVYEPKKIQGHMKAQIYSVSKYLKPHSSQKLFTFFSN